MKKKSAPANVRGAPDPTFKLPDYAALEKYEEELRSDPDLKEREYTVAHFEGEE